MLRAVVDRPRAASGTDLPTPFRHLNAFGLSDIECDEIRETAFRLMVDGRLAAIGEHRNEDGHLYAYVFGSDNELYTVGRHGGVYFILDAEMGIRAVSGRFDEILVALGCHL
jgi:hypothetical protein